MSENQVVEVEKIICDGCGKEIDDKSYRKCALCGLVYCFDCLVKMVKKVRFDYSFRRVSGNVCRYCFESELSKQYAEQREKVMAIYDSIGEEWKKKVKDSDAHEVNKTKISKILFDI